MMTYAIRSRLALSSTMATLPLFSPGMFQEIVEPEQIIFSNCAVDDT